MIAIEKLDKKDRDVVQQKLLTTQAALLKTLADRITILELFLTETGA